MAPTFNKIYSDVSEPYNNGEMNLSEAVESGGGELKKFMVKNTRKNDLLMFAEMANEESLKIVLKFLLHCFASIYYE